jgi:peptidyl-prolyl cis-trans isomerase D
MFITLMRRHTKSILIKIMVGLIAVVFIFWGIYSIREKRGSKVAYVNGDLITGQEYDLRYRELLDSLQKQYKEYWNDNLIKVFQLRERALDSLVDEKLTMQEADSLGLKVTDDEISDAIFSAPAFQEGGKFSMAKYRSILRYHRMEPVDFESRIGSDLLNQKIGLFIQSFFPITEDEIMDYYTYQKEKINIAFASFDPKDFKGKEEIKEDEKKEYFEKNKERYRVPAQIKIAYLVIDPSDYTEKATVSEREISDFYELNMAMFQEPKQVKARHILLTVSKDASAAEDAKIKDKALDLLKQAKAGDDFSELAKKNSQGPTGPEGGDLGYIQEGQMVKPFEDLAFSLKKGEIGGPVRTRFGWHIVKVEDVKEAAEKTLLEVRDEIITALKKDISKDMARERVLALVDQMPYDTDLGHYAAQNGFTVTESDFFPKQGAIPELGADEKLQKSIYSLEKGEISEVIEHNERFYIVQIVDDKDSRIPEMAEVSDQLQKDFTEHLAFIAAEKKAKDYLEELKGGVNWSEGAEKEGLKTGETGFFSREESIPKIGHSPVLSEAAFSLSPEKNYPDQVFEVNSKVYVVKWIARQGIDIEEFNKEKEDFKKALLSAKEGRMSAAWLQYLKDRAKIKLVTPI